MSYGEMNNNQQQGGYASQGYQQQQSYQGNGAFIADDDDLDMNASFEAEESDFEVLPAGHYKYNVIAVESGTYADKKANGKIRKKIVVSIQVQKPDGKTTTLKEHLPLKKNMAWKFTQLFVSVGDQKDANGHMNMDWKGIIGKSGVAKLKIEKRMYEGSEYTSNKVDKLLSPTEAGKVQLAQPAQAQTQNAGFQSQAQPQQQVQQQQQQNVQQMTQHVEQFQQQQRGFTPPAGGFQ